MGVVAAEESAGSILTDGEYNLPPIAWPCFSISGLLLVDATTRITRRLTVLAII